ncbi:MAG: RNA polymerase sigma factor [Nitrospirales bacterium]
MVPTSGTPPVPPDTQTDSLSRSLDDHELKYRSLLQEIAKGNESALTEFYRSFESRIYAFTNIRLNDSHEAADLLNDIMWEIWRSAGKYEGRSSVSTWVFGIAHHRVIDRIRSKSKHRMEPLEVTATEESEEDLYDLLTQKQLGTHMHHCLDKLSLDQRQTVHMAFFEDLSYREIGEIVGSPEGTIKARMFHAKQALKRCLTRRIR